MKKLSKKQKEVISLFNSGWKAENSFMFKNGNKKPVSMSTFETLVGMGVLYGTDTAWSTTHYHLTDFGKAINID